MAETKSISRADVVKTGGAGDGAEAGSIASAGGDVDVRAIVEQLLDEAVRCDASDIHIEPSTGHYELRYRIDGLLETVHPFDSALGRAIVTRLMVLAQLLTYRPNVPQEGRLRISLASTKRPVEMRVSVMPTTNGLRAVVRMPAELIAVRKLDDLNLSPRVGDALREFGQIDVGMLILAGPAGAGKTTSIYALLEYLTDTQPGQSIVCLEDPVERDIAGVTQIEVSPFGELTYERALKSILRQDPQVLMLGEIRDSATAQMALQAALSGHRLISTLHAGSPGTAVARLMEMGLEPYQITSALYGVVVQRLVRRVQADGSYRGRIPLAEFARIDQAARKAILDQRDAGELQDVFSQQDGYTTLRQAAAELIEKGMTDQAEVTRILGKPR